jgi:hypothetical protein
MKHTPGPWKLSKTQVVKCSIYDDEGKPVAHCDRRGSETPANARLIAAAPTMFGKLADVKGFISRLLADMEDNDPDNQWRYQLDEVNDDLTETLRKITEGS